MHASPQESTIQTLSLFCSTPLPSYRYKSTKFPNHKWYGSGYYQIGFIVLDFIGDTKGLCHFFAQYDEIKHTIKGLQSLPYQISVLSEKLDQSAS